MDADIERCPNPGCKHVTNVLPSSPPFVVVLIISFMSRMDSFIQIHYFLRESEMMLNLPNYFSTFCG